MRARRKEGVGKGKRRNRSKKGVIGAEGIKKQRLKVEENKEKEQEEKKGKDEEGKRSAKDGEAETE